MVDLSRFSLVDTGMYGQGTEMPFYFLDNRSDTLLVTIGDSWTWGADLSDSDDEDFRRKYVYGSQVANKLNFDLLNLGQRGSNNFWIALKCKELAELIPTLHYKKTIVVCMFTEVGRGINSWYDKEFNFIDWYSGVNVKDDFYGLLKCVNEGVVDDILKLKNINNVELIFGTNMVDPIGMEKANILIDPWFRILADKFSIPQPPQTYIMHHIAVSPIQSTIDMIPSSKESMFLEWLVDLIDAARQSDYLFSNKELFKGHHPTVLGHNIMAEKIIEEIKSW